MYIEKVISYLGAWETLCENFPDEIENIVSSIDNISLSKQLFDKSKTTQNKKFSIRDFTLKLEKEFRLSGWEINKRIRINFEGKPRFSSMNAVKNSVGIEFKFGKFSFVESDLFVKFPIFINKGEIKLAFVIMPMESLSSKINRSSSGFEMIADRIKSLPSLSNKYPFGIIGISDQQPNNIEIEELTSELDKYLIDTVGYSLFEMKQQNERSNYDFKQDLPQNNKIAKQICAMANHPSGGILIIGVNDNGIISGFPRKEIDDAELKILNINKDSCNPFPKVDFQVFDVTNSPDQCVLVVRVFEVNWKPCMSGDRIYIRSGSSARVAKPNEIRRMLLNIDYE